MQGWLHQKQHRANTFVLVWPHKTWLQVKAILIFSSPVYQTLCVEHAAPQSTTWWTEWRKKTLHPMTWPFPPMHIAPGAVRLLCQSGQAALQMSDVKPGQKHFCSAYSPGQAVQVSPVNANSETSTARSPGGKIITQWREKARAYPV